jgi:hypothetical protein
MLFLLLQYAAKKSSAIKKSEIKKAVEGKNSETPNRRGICESLSQYIENPPLTSCKLGKKANKASQPSLVNILQAAEHEKTQFK